jgi:FKBP-type peptidyl-prolyl cis-trans isomerase
MLKAVIVIVIVVLSAAILLSQTRKSATHKAAATAGPVKVTGPGTDLPGGLKYWDIKQGTGPEVKKGDTVKMEYTGWLTSGKKFDSNAGTGRPFTVKLGNGDVIKGWDEGIPGMKVGGKRQLRIPPDMAYGANGYPGVIPPNSTLIFDVTLLGKQ